MDYKYEGKTTENEHGIVVEGRLIPQPTDKELLTMADLIRRHCLEKEKCDDCVFNCGGYCDLSECPMGWILRGRKEWKK